MKNSIKGVKKKNAEGKKKKKQNGERKWKKMLKGSKNIA